MELPTKLHFDLIEVSSHQVIVLDLELWSRNFQRKNTDRRVISVQFMYFVLTKLVLSTCIGSINLPREGGDISIEYILFRIDDINSPFDESFRLIKLIEHRWP